MTQNDRIIDYMREHGSITQAEAMTALGCFRLGARIWDIKQRGMKIRRIMEAGIKRFGDRTFYARYYMEAQSGTPDTL